MWSIKNEEGRRMLEIANVFQLVVSDEQTILGERQT